MLVRSGVSSSHTGRFLMLQNRIHRHPRGIVPWLLAGAVFGFVWLTFFRTKHESFEMKMGIPNSKFAVPFCDPDTGVCHEAPDEPSPRTIYSAKSAEQYQQWWRYNAQLDLRAAQFETEWNTKHANEKTQKQPNGIQQQERPLILLGDSITESWLGTNMGEPTDRARGIPQVLDELLLQQTFVPLVLAIGGDQTQHLLYRIQQKKQQLVLAQNPQAVYVVLIGTNNLGSGELPGPTSQGVWAVADALLENTQGTVLLLHILPRGDVHRLARICPPRCRSNSDTDNPSLPYASWMPAVQKVNAALTAGVDERHYGAHRLQLVDCGKPFLMIPGGDSNKNSNPVNASLMPDLLHPNAAGQRLLGECILRNIE